MSTETRIGHPLACTALGALAALALGATAAFAQTFGFASMQPGTLNHTSASAIAKVVKDKAGVNVVVQPTAGESMLIALVGRGEAEFGIANIFEVEAAKAANPNLRLIGSLHPLRGAFWVRKDTPMKTVADLKGKKVVLAGIPHMTPELAWIFAVFRAPCKAEGQFGQLPSPRASQTTVQG